MRHLLVIFSVLFVSSPGCGPSGDSRKVRTHAKPTLATLTPSLTSLALELGAQAHLVGVSQYGPRPAGVPVVAGMRPNMELLLHHRPDIVAVGKFPYNAGDIASMQHAGLNVVALDLVTLDDLRRWANRLGGLMSQGQRAAAFIARLDRSLDAAGKGAEGRKNRRVLLVYGRSGGSFFSTGGGDHVSELIERLGMTNVAAGGPVTARLSLERIVHLAPDTIIHITPDPELPTSLDALTFWRRVAPQLPAARAGRVLAVDDDKLALNGPSLIDGLDALVSKLDALPQ